jgi:hypothetical protein
MRAAEPSEFAVENELCPYGLYLYLGVIIIKKQYIRIKIATQA